VHGTPARLRVRDRLGLVHRRLGALELFALVRKLLCVGELRAQLLGARVRAGLAEARALSRMGPDE